MKTPAIIALLISSTLAGDEKLPPVGGDPIPGIPRTPAGIQKFEGSDQKAFRLEAEADFVAEYTSKGKLDIGVGRTDEEGTYYPKLLKFNELKGFFDRQKHQDLVVVIIHKQAWSKRKLKTEVEKIRTFFVARGYKRIVIQQFYGNGRGTHLDFTAAPKQPKTVR